MNTFTTLKSKRWFKILFILLKIFVVLYIIWNLLIIFLTWPNYWDDTTINDADLIPVTKGPVAPELNAVTYVPIQNDVTDFERSILAKILTYKNNQFYIDDEVVDRESLQKFISDSKPLVKKFEQAAAQSVYQCPLSFSQYHTEAELCQLSTLRSLATLVAFHAEYALTNMDVNKAVELTTSLLSMGHLMVEQENPEALIEHLVGFAHMKLALDVIEDHAELKNIIKPTIQKYLVSDAPSARALNAEYLTQKNAIILGLRGETEKEKKFSDQGTYFLRPKETVNNLAEYYRLSMDVSNTPCNVSPDYTKLESVYSNYSKSPNYINIYKPNFFGQLALSMIVTTNIPLRNTRCEINNRITTIAN